MGRRSELEVILAHYLERLGLRFEVNVRDLPGSPDVVFRDERLVVFVHGCVWHGHGVCGATSRNGKYGSVWRQKIEYAIKNDAEVSIKLAARGWRVMTFWECELQESFESAARSVSAQVAPGAIGVLQSLD